MSNAQNSAEPANKQQTKSIGKIEKAEITSEAGTVKQSADNELAFNEKSTLEATRLLLREHGLRRSGAAIREAVDIPHETVGPREAVSAISSFGFKASFGRLKIKNLGRKFFPLIAFSKNGEACVINSEPIDDNIIISKLSDRKQKQIKLSDFERDFSGYVIIAKQLSKREAEDYSGHWFSVLSGKVKDLCSSYDSSHGI